MKNADVKIEDSKIHYKHYASFFGPTFFKGWEYVEAIKFLEVMIDGLKEQSEETGKTKIPDMLGREYIL